LFLRALLDLRAPIGVSRWIFVRPSLRDPAGTTLTDHANE